MIVLDRTRLTGRSVFYKRFFLEGAYILQAPFFAIYHEKIQFGICDDILIKFYWKC